MIQLSNEQRRVQVRNLLFMSTPQLWPLWPFLALMRRRPGCEEECGLLYDIFHINGLTGYSCTVFLSNIFFTPSSQEEFLLLPKEVYDTVEEMYAAGWRVD